MIVLLALLLGGCGYRVALTSSPPGASVELPDGRRAVTPSTVRVPWKPFAPPTLCVRAPGYRAAPVTPQREVMRPLRLLTAPLAMPARLVGIRPHAEVEVILVPTHGLPGSSRDASNLSSSCP